MEKVEQDVRSFIVDRFLHGRADVPVSRDALLVDESIVDSTGMLEIVSFLEERYGIRVGDHDVIPDNLGSIARIATYVQRKRG